MNRDLIDADPVDSATATAATATTVVERRVTLSADSSEEEVQQVQDMVASLRRKELKGVVGVDSEEDDVTVTYLQSDGRVSEGVDALEAMELDLDDIEVSGEDSDQEVIEMVSGG